MSKLILVLSVMVLFSACQETKRVFIGGHLVDCEGVAPQKCMLYKENIANDWTYFYDTIEGFDYEEGYTYELEIVVNQIENPPEDGSSLHYTLVKILSKEKDQMVSRSIAHSIQSQQENVQSIVYEASTRGSFFQVKINKDVIEKTKDRSLNEINSRKCSKKDWDTVLSLLENIQLEKIKNLAAPTDKRASDRALHAQLKITSGDSIYTSVGFDHGNPPKEIEQLVTTILSLAESIE
ncbi:DUF4377 domain-containing protein [Aquimarina sp. 2304DJ70-9]|uniref:DUF4377 domain-containing protein n=1 Tax=Aquimarina penaris TaxID=3231044 RepID=UPI003462C5F5